MVQFNIGDIIKILPHSYPLLLVDRVIECDPGKSIKALKNVTFNEPFFTGHFPGNPIMPGVLIIESLAQASAICVLSKENRLLSKLASEKQVLGAHGAEDRSVLNIHEDLSTGVTTQLPTEVECQKKSNQNTIENTVVYFMSIENAKFRKPVTPGDTLILQSNVRSTRLSACKFECIAYVGGEKVAEAIILATVRNVK